VRRRYVWKSTTVIVHILLWVGLATWSYLTAGLYRFANCWSIIMFYIPPLGFLWLGVGLGSLAVLIASISRPNLRASWWFFAACHGLVLALGLQAAPLAAYLATGQVDCL
jgi:hypothetical protein